MCSDLLVVWPGAAGIAQPHRGQKIVIECKVRRGSLKESLADDLSQATPYMDRAGADEGHLVIFDRTAGRTWEERMFRHAEHEGDKRVTVWEV